jgi:membrane-bound serine protease (ClpP class)
LFLFDPEQSDISIKVSWQVVASLTAVSAIFFASVARARGRPVRTGAEQMIGSTGEVVSWTADHGHVQVHGEIWAARSAHELAKGRKVRVTSRTGLILAVEPST